MKHKETGIDREFGKALCDRLGLRLNDTLTEWQAESFGKQHVMVTMTIVRCMSEDEFNELRRVAERRATP